MAVAKIPDEAATELDRRNGLVATPDDVAAVAGAGMG